MTTDGLHPVAPGGDVIGWTYGRSFTSKAQTRPMFEQRITGSELRPGEGPLEAGIEACQSKQACWCPVCNTTRYRRDMHWLMDLFVCH